MMLRTLAVIGLSTLTATATLASVNDGRDITVPTLEAWAFELPEVDLTAGPRRVNRAERREAKVYPKTPSERLFIPISKDGTQFNGTGRILVKFRNEARVRAELFASRTLTSAAGLDVSIITDLLEQNEATIQQLIQKSPNELDTLRRVVFERSNRVQPDFAAFTVVGFPSGVTSDVLLALGRKLNDLDLVEWVEFETPILSASPMSGSGDTTLPTTPASTTTTNTPDFTSAPWLNEGNAIPPGKIQGPIPPADAFNFPPYTNQSDVLQQYQIGNQGPLEDPLPPVNPLPDDDDPSTWFKSAKFIGASGYNIPAMVRLAGQSWRRYGSPPVGPDGTVRNGAPRGNDPCPLPTQPFYVGGCGPVQNTSNIGFLGTLPSPTKVWMYGAEFEIVDITAYNQAGGAEYPERTYGEGFIPDPNNADGPWIPNPDCPGCISGYPVIPRLESGEIPLKNSGNPFPEFATDLLNLQIYENIILCPTGNRTEIGVVDIAAFDSHEEWLIGRYGEFIEPEDRQVIFEDGQTMVLLEGQAGEFFRDNASHGTAVAGVLVAGNNNFGLTGMTWASRVQFFPSLSSEEGARLASAITSAIIALEPGSILCCPIQTPQGTGGTDAEIGVYTGPAAGALGGPQKVLPPLGALSEDGAQHLSTNTVYSQLLNAARDAGLIVVQAAGNGGVPCGSDPGGENGTGVGIICTAVTPSGVVNNINLDGTGDICSLAYVPPGDCEFVAPYGETPCSYYGMTILAECSEDAPFPSYVVPWPYAGQTRWPGSNFFGPGGEESANIRQRTVSGWGMGVPSLGYGDFYRNENPPLFVGPDGVDPLERDFLRSYTGPRPDAPTYNPSGEAEVTNSYEFGNVNNLNHNGLIFQGTSLAATQTAGLAAWLQGFGQMFYGTNLSDDQIISAMGVDFSEVNFAETLPTAFETEPVGFVGGTPAAGQNNSAVGGTAALVPRVPSGPGSVIGVLTQIGQSFNGVIDVYWGTRLRGSKFALANEGDGNVLAIRSEPANLGQQNAGLTYIVTGETTDLGIAFESPADATDVISMELIVNARANAPAVVEVPYVRNFNLNRYVPLGVNLLPIAFEQRNYALGNGGTLDIAAFVDENQNVDIRFYSIGMGFIGSSTYVVEYDFVNLLVNEDNAPL
ncbi:MAG: hypothetical protein GY895_19210 [Phycisphaera sp.]|nr:hypothetical protein [Phycisphaera sp.]